ncbi:hypothetical protein BKA70DRAFT_1257293 [Coprinopsis sp. MPI-PUGE-AT-0042]|nr:hypothetical protein BKA70DRAFT_1257293 [Coprinopsis sp. MPI-PUGE-AT-0042]
MLFLAAFGCHAIVLVVAIPAAPSKDTSTSPPSSWIYCGVITAISVSLTLLLWARGSFSRRRQDASATSTGGGVGIPSSFSRISRHINLDKPQRCHVSPSKTSFKSGIMVGFLGSPAWEVTGFVQRSTTLPMMSPIGNRLCEMDQTRSQRRTTSLPKVANISSRDGTVSWIYDPSKYRISSNAPAQAYLAEMPCFDTRNRPLSLPTAPLTRSTSLPQLSGILRRNGRTSTFVQDSNPRNLTTSGTRLSSRERSPAWQPHCPCPPLRRAEGQIEQNLSTPVQHVEQPLRHPTPDHKGQSTKPARSIEMEPFSSTDSFGLRARSTASLSVYGTNSPRESLRTPQTQSPTWARRPLSYRASRTPPVGPSPLRSMILPASSTQEVTDYLLSEEDHPRSPTVHDIETPSKARRHSIQSNGSGPHIDSSRLLQGAFEGDLESIETNSSHQMYHSGSHPRLSSSSTRDSHDLEDIIHQLVRATSEWDDSLFVNGEFKSLIETSRSPTSEGTPIPPLQEATLDEEENPFSYFTNLSARLQNSYTEMVPGPLFSIPEEESSM